MFVITPFLMYRNFQKYFKAIVAAALTAATISACDKAPANGEEEEVIDSSISIASSKVVSVDSEMGTFEIRYSVTGPAAERIVEVLPDCDWLAEAEEPTEPTEPTTPTAKSVEAPVTEGTVVVSFTENDTESSRAGKVSLHVEGAKPVSVSVIQKANSDYVVNSQISFTLDTQDATETSVFFTVAPNESETYYYYGFFPAKDFDAFSDPAEFVKSTVADMKAYADKYEAETGKKFDLKSYLFKGYRSTTQSNLDPATDYCLVAFDLTLGWKYSGNVASSRFRTQTVPPSSSAFKITYDQQKGILGVEPTELASGWFAIGLTPLEIWTELKAPSAMVENYVENSSYISAYSVADGYRGLPLYSYSDIEDGVDYVAFAFLYNNSKVSEIAWLEFRYVKP